MSCLVPVVADANLPPSVDNEVTVVDATAEAHPDGGEPGVDAPLLRLGPIRCKKVGVIVSIPNPTTLIETDLLEAARDACRLATSLPWR